jgi:hypothetical protein
LITSITDTCGSDVNIQNTTRCSQPRSATNTLQGLEDLPVHVTHDRHFSLRSTVVELNLAAVDINLGPPQQAHTASTFAFTMVNQNMSTSTAWSSHSVFGARKYKPVAKKVKPVPAMLPEEFCVIRHHPYNPLDTLPELPHHPPDIEPGERLTHTSSL